MIKSITFSAAILCAGIGAAAAQTATPVDALGSIVAAPVGIVAAPLGDADASYPNRGAYEGRSVYRVPTSPEAFYNESDEKGDRSRDAENPQFGGQ
jgi:hypothetical protein